jgi:hypothetical protein
MDCQQLQDVIVKPTLIALGLWSPSAVNLLLGTAAQESQMGKYLVQQKIGFRGGIGIYQMQAPAFMSTWDKMVTPNPVMRNRLKLLLGYEGRPVADRMASDLLLATAMCRLYYAAINTALPQADDINGLAHYWKIYYNSEVGKGTTQQFVENYRNYVLD